MHLLRLSERLSVVVSIVLISAQQVRVTDNSRRLQLNHVALNSFETFTSWITIFLQFLANRKEDDFVLKVFSFVWGIDDRLFAISVRTETTFESAYAHQSFDIRRRRDGTFLARRRPVANLNGNVNRVNDPANTNGAYTVPESLLRRGSYRFLVGYAAAASRPIDWLSARARARILLLLLFRDDHRSAVGQIKTKSYEASGDDWYFRYFNSADVVPTNSDRRRQLYTYISYIYVCVCVCMCIATWRRLRRRGLWPCKTSLTCINAPPLPSPLLLLPLPSPLKSKPIYIYVYVRAYI